MARVTGLTADRMQEIIDQQILQGAVDLSGDLILTRANGTTLNAGTVKGPKGDDGQDAVAPIATQLDVQNGVDNTKIVTPLGLTYVIGKGTGYRLYQTLRYSSSATFVRASHPDVRAIRVIVVGGGGSGASCGAASLSQNAYGTGGGSGAYAESFYISMDFWPPTIPITVGAGGAAPEAGVNNGIAGGASSFRTTVAGGGEGGLSKLNSTLGGYVQGGAGGTATQGQVQQGGSPGGNGMGQNGLAQGGNGGSSFFGGGGRGPASGSNLYSHPGADGSAYGAGGSGASANSGGSAQPGGAGANGIVILEMYR